MNTHAAVLRLRRRCGADAVGSQLLLGRDRGLRDGGSRGQAHRDAGLVGALTPESEHALLRRSRHGVRVRVLEQQPVQPGQRPPGRERRLRLRTERDAGEALRVVQSAARDYRVQPVEKRRRADRAAQVRRQRIGRTDARRKGQRIGEVARDKSRGREPVDGEARPGVERRQAKLHGSSPWITSLAVGV
jgi:hypothetical protein